MLDRNTQEGPRFRVRVVSQERVNGLRVKLTSSLEGHISFAEIDGKGFATFRNIRPGTYNVNVEPQGLTNGIVLSVGLQGPSDIPMPLQWPGVVPIRTRSLEGRIRWSGSLPGQPGARLSFDVLELTSARWIASLQTDDDSEFSGKGLSSNCGATISANSRLCSRRPPVPINWWSVAADSRPCGGQCRSAKTARRQPARLLPSNSE